MIKTFPFSLRNGSAVTLRVMVHVNNLEKYKHYIEWSMRFLYKTYKTTANNLIDPIYKLSFRIITASTFLMQVRS